MNAITNSFITRGDLAHLALFLWAIGASAMLAVTLRDAADARERSTRIIQEFLQELTRFNRSIEGDEP
jgi:hypothetical protein